MIVDQETMYSEPNKQKRSVYVRALITAIGTRKTPIFLEESNCNLFLRWSESRSKKGTRCCVKAACSRGKNIHIIARISQLSLVYWERRRGSYKNDDCCEWLWRLLRSVNDRKCRIVTVCVKMLPFKHCSKMQSLQVPHLYRALLTYSVPCQSNL